MSKNTANKVIGGRPKSELPTSISAKKITAVALLLDPADDALIKVQFRLPEHLAEHIRKAIPRTADFNSAVLAALKTFGYPTTRDALEKLQQKNTESAPQNNSPSTSNVIALPAKRGRPRKNIQVVIDDGRLRGMSALLDPSENEEIRVYCSLPGFLKDLITATLPRKSSFNSLAIAGFQNLGFPVTPEDLIEMQEAI